MTGTYILHIISPYSEDNEDCAVYVPLTVLHSGDYYLFESDSEDDEELQSEEQKPQSETACQVRDT